MLQRRPCLIIKHTQVKFKRPPNFLTSKFKQTRHGLEVKRINLAVRHENMFAICNSKIAGTKGYG